MHTDFVLNEQQWGEHSGGARGSVKLSQAPVAAPSSLLALEARLVHVRSPGAAPLG